MAPFGPHAAEVTVDLGEAHNLSIDVLKQLHSQDIDGATGAVALILSAGRIMCPDIMSDEEEVSFINTAMEWLGLYFAAGGKN
jgi:hypothetical protein